MKALTRKRLSKHQRIWLAKARRAERLKEVKALKQAIKRRKRLKMTYHHILASSRGGKNESSNMLKLKSYRHEGYHDFFGRKTLEEAIELLIRVHRAKKRCLPNCKYCGR